MMRDSGREEEESSKEASGEFTCDHHKMKLDVGDGCVEDMGMV